MCIRRQKCSLKRSSIFFWNVVLFGVKKAVMFTYFKKKIVEISGGFGMKMLLTWHSNSFSNLVEGNSRNF